MAITGTSSMFDEIRKLVGYLKGKKSEIEELDIKDIVMAKAILDIHRTRTHKEIVSVPLFALHQIHLLDRENAIEATRQRAEILEAHRDELLEHGTLSCELLARFLPSVSWIKVVEEKPKSYLAFEGNGRIAAMQRVFSPEEELTVEVELYRFRRPKKIVRRLNRVRRLNGLLVFLLAVCVGSDAFAVQGRGDRATAAGQRDSARAFLDDPDAARAGSEAGVLDGEYHFRQPTNPY